MNAIADLQHPAEGQSATVSYAFEGGRFYVEYTPTRSTVERLPHAYDTLDETIMAAQAFAAKMGFTVDTPEEFHRQHEDLLNFLANENKHFHADNGGAFVQPLSQQPGDDSDLG